MCACVCRVAVFVGWCTLVGILTSLVWQWLPWYLSDLADVQAHSQVKPIVFVFLIADGKSVLPSSSRTGPPHFGRSAQVSATKNKIILQTHYSNSTGLLYCRYCRVFMRKKK